MTWRKIRRAMRP